MSLKDSYRKNQLKRSTWKGLLVVFITVLTIAVTSFIKSYFARTGLKEEASLLAESQLERTKLEIMDVIDQAETAVRNSIWISQWCLKYLDSLQRVATRVVEDNPVIIGSTVALVPGYSSRRPLFSPYVYRNGDTLSFRSLATEEYDYPSQEWFVKPIEENRGYWSEPYLDTGGGDMLMTTYSVPIKDLKGRIAAVLTGDISLKWLTRIVRDIRIYPNAKVMMISRTGRFMVSPTEELVMQKTVHELVEQIKDNTDYKRLNQAMLSGETGHIEMSYRGENCYVYYSPVERTGWSMCILIPEDDIYGSLRRMGILTRLLEILGLLLLIVLLRSMIRSQIKFQDIDEKRQRMEGDLRVAHNIQMSMVPKVFPPFPERDDLDIAASIIPAREVGGDLYDYYIRDGKFLFCIGDVSGKGVSASLVMSMTRTAFRTLSAREDSPKQIVTAMNESLSDMNESNMFVTFFCGILDLGSGLLRYCNAGHNPPLLLTDDIRKLPAVPNIPLGLVPGMEFTEQEQQMRYDNALFLYTDGLTEAENEAHEQFGDERTAAALHGRKKAEDHLKFIQEKVAAFVNGAPQSDDLTMLFLHYLGGEKTDRLTLTNDIRELSRLPEWVESVAAKAGMDAAATTNVNLALEEAVTNVIVYAYPEGVQGTLDIEAKKEDGSLIFTLTDSGKPFDPTAHKEDDSHASLGEHRIGGWGIHLVLKLMDSVSYRRENGNNILTLKKSIR